METTVPGLMGRECLKVSPCRLGAMRISGASKSISRTEPGFRTTASWKGNVTTSLDRSGAIRWGTRQPKWRQVVLTGSLGRPSVSIMPETSPPANTWKRYRTLVGVRCMQAVPSSEGQRCPMHSANVTLAKEYDVKSVANNDTGTPIPGPHPWNIVENIIDLSKIAMYGIEEATLLYSKKYGGICRFSNGITAWTFVNDPEIVGHICFVNIKNYSLRFLPAVYEYVTHGKGILGSQGDYNREHRRLCQPPFLRPLQLKQFSQAISSKVQDLVDLWATTGGTRNADIAVHMQRLTLDVIGRVAFSYDFGQLARIRDDPTGTGQGSDSGGDTLMGAVNDSQELMGRVFITPLPLLRLLNKAKEPGMMRLDQSLLTMRGVMMKAIQERRQQLAESGDAGDDLLGALLMAEDEEGRALSDTELWEDVHDVMGAGHETTATTLTCTLFLISQHPHVEAEVLRELEDCLGGRPPTYEDVNKGQLPYLTMAVKEALRMYPPIPLFPRQVAADDTLPGGYKVPGGDVVFMSTYAMGRNEDYWPEPLKFDPDRFLPEAESGRPRFAWVPFGAGPRMCLGAAFALMSVTQIAAALLQKYKFTAVKPTTPDLKFKYDITMNFPGGVIMNVEPRK